MQASLYEIEVGVGMWHKQAREEAKYASFHFQASYLVSKAFSNSNPKIVRKL